MDEKNKRKKEKLRKNQWSKEITKDRREEERKKMWKTEDGEREREGGKERRGTRKGV